MSQLPLGWQIKTLGDVCNLIGGGTPAKKNEDFYKGEISWATVRDMNVDVITQTEFKITEDAVKNSSTNIINAGNVVIATRVGLGKVCLVNQDTAINQDLRGIVPLSLDVLTVRFLFWWLRSIAHLIEQEGTGATVKGVKLPFVKSLQIPLPPLPEQKRIVAILDEAFAGITQAVANAEKNLANARELFESYLNNVFTQKGEGWVEKPLGTVIQITHGFAFKGPDFRVSSDKSLPIVLTPGNYTEDAVLNFNDKNTKRLKIESPDGYEFNEGDLTIVMTDLSSKMKILGKPAFIESKGILHNQRIGRILFSDGAVSKRYLYYHLQSRKVSDAIKSTATGTMVRHTAPKRILSGKISFPSERELQDKVVETLDTLKTETQHLETIYQQKLKALSELKQSILQKAFEGELTADTAQQQVNV